MKTMHHGQMSESFLTAVFLSLSGGLQDAYTYLFRGKVFANAQTGNIVLLSAHIMDGQWGMVLHYFIPLCAFAFGVLVAERMRERFRSMQRLHWRHRQQLGLQRLQGVGVGIDHAQGTPRTRGHRLRRRRRSTKLAACTPVRNSPRRSCADAT